MHVKYRVPNPSSMFIKSPLCTRHWGGHKEVHGIVPELRKHHINQGNSYTTHCVKCQEFIGGWSCCERDWSRNLHKGAGTWAGSQGIGRIQIAMENRGGHHGGNLSISNSLAVMNLSQAGSLDNTTTGCIHWALSISQIWGQELQKVKPINNSDKKVWLPPFLDGERKIQRICYFA